MIIDCKGLRIDKFQIPSFTLHKGEIVTINLFNGGHFFALERALVAIFTGKAHSEHVTINAPMMFAEYYHESFLERWLRPMTVRRYVQKQAQATALPFDSFPDDRLQPETKIRTLGGNPRKFLSIYAVISQCKGLIFDLAGNDPGGASELYRFVEAFVTDNEGYALLLNNFDDMKGICAKHYEVELMDKPI